MSKAAASGLDQPEVRIAADLARELHAEQRRKYTGEPYFSHLHEVARLCDDVDAGPCVLAAAYLHDAIEDQGATAESIAAAFASTEFGAVVAELVMEVTDVSKPSDGNRKARKAMDRDHLAKASANGQTIKLADIISNTASIARHDPAFAKVYLREKTELLPLLRRGHPRLWAMAQHTLSWIR